MSNSNTKKKEVPLNDTFYNLCKDLLRFIDRKIIKKYISPNIAQLPKEMRNHENKIDKQNEVWTYFYKDKEVTKEEKIKDVFKDDIFLGHLQNLNNSLNIVLDYLEQNQINIKKLEDDVKNKELWEEFVELFTYLVRYHINVELHKVKGHSGVKYNEEVDALARLETQKQMES